MQIINTTLVEVSNETVAVVSTVAAEVDGEEDSVDIYVRFAPVSTTLHWKHHDFRLFTIRTK